MYSDEGYVYLLKQTEHNLYKIGSSKNIKQRLLNLQTGSPQEIILIDKYKSFYYKNIELALHNFSLGYKKRGEWFSLPETFEGEFTQECVKIENNLRFLRENLI